MRFIPALLILSVASLPSPAFAGWFDANWQFRRVLNVNWDSENASGSELATADFYVNGHFGNPNAPGVGAAADLRVLNSDGRVVPSHVLYVGPGDRLRFVFALTPHQTKYYAYFDNPSIPPTGTPQDVQFHCGLLLDMHTWTGGRVNTPQALAQAFTRGDEVGQVMIDEPFYGMNPFGQPTQWISKISGSLSVPVGGEYEFAGGAQSRAALFIDNQPVLFIPGPARNIKFNTTLSLTRGRHDFVMYHVNVNSDGWFSLGWQRPDMPRVQIIDRQPFGILAHAQPAPLEQYQKTFVADFHATYLGEYETQEDGQPDHFSHHYRLTADLPPFPGAKAHWDFGDGQTAAGAVVEHVWVNPGIYSIRLTVSSGENSDTQTTRFSVDRDWEHLDQPQDEEASAQSPILAKYDLSSVPSAWLPWMAQIHQAAGNTSAMIAVVNRMASDSHHDDATATFARLADVFSTLLDSGKPDAVINILDRVPADSDLQPRAALYEARTLLWWTGDLPKAEKILEPYSQSDDTDLQLTRAQALTLIGRADEAKKILQNLPIADSDRDKLAAISGAMARTIEYRIDQKDWQTGEQEWDLWQRRCPTVFLEGYSVLLRIRLMESNTTRIPAAAAIAEAFARAVPESPYAPQLLDRASKLLATSDPQKSTDLRTLLKTRYPEDPIAQ